MQPIENRRTTGLAHHHLLLAAAVVLAGSMGCSRAEPEAPKGTAVETRAKTQEDRGSATLQIGETSWQARSASARLRNETLRISASKAVRNGDAVQSERLSLTIPGFDGPGQYRAAMGSMFVRVGMDIPQDADDGEAAAGKLLVDAMSAASTTRLAEAEIEVSAVSGGFIEGRFVQAAAGASPENRIEGAFRARLRD